MVNFITMNELPSKTKNKSFNGNFRRPRMIVICADGCKCTAGCARLHVAGSPCVDWSNAGKRLGGGGPTVLVYFVWVAQRLVYQEDRTRENFTFSVLPTSRQANTRG